MVTCSPNIDVPPSTTHSTLMRRRRRHCRIVGRGRNRKHERTWIGFIRITFGIEIRIGSDVVL